MMERLTKRLNTREALMASKYEGKYTVHEWISVLQNRLASYEDTGLTPEEIERIVDAYGRGQTLRTENAQRLEAVRDIGADRLRELAEADRAGRVVDYKPGDTVYDCFGMAWTVTTAEIHFIGGELRYLYRCGHEGTNDYCALWRCEILTREEAEKALRRAGE